MRAKRIVGMNMDYFKEIAYSFKKNKTDNEQTTTLSPGETQVQIIEETTQIPDLEFGVLGELVTYAKENFFIITIAFFVALCFILAIFILFWYSSKQNAEVKELKKSNKQLKKQNSRLKKKNSMKEKIKYSSGSKDNYSVESNEESEHLDIYTSEINGDIFIRFADSSI